MGQVQAEEGGRGIPVLETTTLTMGNGPKNAKSLGAKPEIVMFKTTETIQQISMFSGA